MSVLLGKTSCQLLVDTGSSVTLVSRSIVPSSIRLQSGNVNIQTLCGNTFQTSHIWSTVIQLGRFKRRVKVLVVDFPLPASCDGILGVDVMQAAKSVLDFSSHQIRIGGDRIQLIGEGTTSSHLLTGDLVDGPVEVVSLRTAEALTVAPRVETIISTIASSSKLAEGIVSPISSNLPKGLLIGKSVNKMHNGNVFVRVANLADHSVVLPANTAIAVLEEAECQDAIFADKAALPEFLSDIFLRSNEHFNAAQQQSAEELLREFGDIFCTGPDDLGRTNTVQHRIDVGTAKPVKQPPRRLPLAKQEESRRIIDDMLRRNIIEPCSSPWASPIVMVRKKDGSTRERM